MLAELRERGVHVEVCPSSSVETGGWRGAAAAARPFPRWEEHPAVAMRKAGVSLGFNSDDPYVFGASLVEGMGIAFCPAVGDASGVRDGAAVAAAAAAAAASADAGKSSTTAQAQGGMGFDRKAMVKSVEDAIDASFADTEQKETLLGKLREYCRV